MQQKLSHCRDGFSLLAGTFRLAAWRCKQASRLFRDAQAGKPARQFRLEAEVTLWLKKSQMFKFDEVRQRFRLTPTIKTSSPVRCRGVRARVDHEMLSRRASVPCPCPNSFWKSRASRSSSAKVDQPGAPKASETARRTRKSAEKLNLPDSPTGQDYQQK